MIKRRYIDGIHDGQIHLAETQAQTLKSESVFMLHQTPRSWDEFREVMQILATDVKCIAMDLPGMGGSTAIGSKPNIENYAKAAILVLEKLSSGPLTICGHHTGGVVAIEIAAKRPDLVKSLILSSTPWIDAAERDRRSTKTPIDFIQSNRDGSHLLDLWKQRSEYYPAQPGFMDRFIASALCCEQPADGHYAVGNYAMEKVVEFITCPILIVEHAMDPFAAKHTKHLLHAFPNADLRSIASGRVALEVTAPEFAECVLSWIQRQK